MNFFVFFLFSLNAYSSPSESWISDWTAKKNRPLIEQLRTQYLKDGTFENAHLLKTKSDQPHSIEILFGTFTQSEKNKSLRIVQKVQKKQILMTEDRRCCIIHVIDKRIPRDPIDLRNIPDRHS